MAPPFDLDTGSGLDRAPGRPAGFSRHVRQRPQLPNQQDQVDVNQADEP